MDAQFQVQVAQLGKSTVVFGDGGSQLPGYCAAVIRLWAEYGECFCFTLHFISCLGAKSCQAKQFSFCDKLGKDLVKLDFSTFGKICGSLCEQEW